MILKLKGLLTKRERKSAPWQTPSLDAARKALDHKPIIAYEIPFGFKFETLGREDTVTFSFAVPATMTNEDGSVAWEGWPSGAFVIFEMKGPVA